MWLAAPASTAQLRHVITGVAMATTSGHLRLYFGCTAQTPIIGGAGLVRMSTPDDNDDHFRLQSTKVVPVRTAAAELPLFAGSMLVTEQRRTQSQSAKESSASRVLPVMLCMFLLFHVTWFHWQNSEKAMLIKEPTMHIITGGPKKWYPFIHVSRL